MWVCGAFHGSSIKKILQEAHPQLCASHIMSTIVMLLGMKNLKKIWPVYHQAGWWREPNNEKYLKRAKAVTTAIRKGIAPAEVGHLTGKVVA